MAGPAVGAVIGTAGHIDHGKTALVRALTGIDTDRLKEEKARGITIELGFAHLALPSGRTVGVVDVPGHERFVRTMVAGAVGVDLIVLVVAADEGVMPQTREHLDICELLGLRCGVVALNKIDAVDAELRAIAEAELREALAGSFLRDAPIMRCSAQTGEGLAELRSAIDVALAQPPAIAGAWPAPLRDVDGPMRLPIDRVFTMKGFGSVVTGTLWSGRLRVGDEVELLPEPLARQAKVRGLQVHGGAAEVVEAGHRLAVNLPLARDAMERGLVLAHAGRLEAGCVFDAALRCLPSARRPLKRRTLALLHAGTTQVDVTIRLLEGESLAPGATAFVEIEATRPLVLLPGDRYILRGGGPQKGYGTTLGGGVVVRVLGRRSRRGAPTAPDLLARNLAAHVAGDVDARVRLELERAGEVGIARAGLERRLPFSSRAIGAALERALAKRTLFRFDRERDAYVTDEAVQHLAARALAAVAAHHAEAPLDGGPPREALRASVADDPRLLHLVLESLLSSGHLVAERDRVRLAAHDPSRSAAAGGELGERILARLEVAGLQPPRPAELAIELGVDARELARALELLARAGRAKHVKDLYFATTQLEALRQRLVAYLEVHGVLTPQGWKELVGASRKFTIPLAEHFDAEKVTLRVGDNRRLRR